MTSRAWQHYVIYAVVLKSHPSVVKLGQTTAWKQRRRQYDFWNLCDGDGIKECAAYCVTEEYTCLRSLEGECLAIMRTRYPVFRRYEWFRATLQDAREVIEETLIDNALSFIEL